jgi:hypothetical protein
VGQDVPRARPGLAEGLIPWCDIHTGNFGRFYGFPESCVTVGIGCDYMGEAKKGMLRMAMYQAKQRGYLGIHAGTKVVRAQNARTGGFTRYGVAILGNSGTGKTTNVGHALPRSAGGSRWSCRTTSSGCVSRRRVSAPSKGCS